MIWRIFFFAVELRLTLSMAFVTLKPMKRVAIFAGSFDPPTNGHLWMMRRGAEMFDELVVALALNPDKKGFLSLDEREEALRRLLAELPPNVRVATVRNGFLVDFAREVGASYLLRGIRNSMDFEYEKTLARVNARMEPGIQTVFLMPPSELEEISSSIVRGFFVLPGGERWVKASVPACVFDLVSARCVIRA